SFTTIMRVRSTGTASRYRSVPRLASPAIESAAIADTAIGRNSGSSTVSATSAAKTPFWVTWLRKGGPCAPDGGDTLTAMTIRTGTAASTAMPTQLRRRPKMSSSSDRKNLVENRCGVRTSASWAGTWAGPARRRSSAADIEALPGELHEHLLQVSGEHPEPAYRYVGVDERGDHLLRCGV